MMSDQSDTGKPLDSEQLDLIRRRIDSLDQRLLELISERARLAADVLAAKGGADQRRLFYRPEREAQVMRRVTENNPGPLGDDVILRLFREIMSACLAQQEPLRIAYLGPEGTFTQQAVHRQFGQSVHAISQPAIEEVFAQVQGGDADFGVVPVENSSQGIVSHTLDMFLDFELKICGEVEIPIHHNLMTRASGLSAIERVYSHQQSLAQCRGWLRDHLPQAELITVASNAEAARRARLATDAAAIAGRSAAEIYGLPILFSDIEDHADNRTRFLVIGRGLFPPSGHDKTTLLLAGDGGPGGLYSLLKPLADQGINMSRIESRPSRIRRWDYVFFIDADGHSAEAPLSDALAELEQTAQMCLVLGAYPKAIQASDSTPKSGRGQPPVSDNSSGVDP